MSEVGDQIAHWAIGFVVFGLVALSEAQGEAIVLILGYGSSGLLFGVVREDAQHRKEEGWHWVLEGTYRRWMDVGFIGLGGLCIGLLRGLGGT